MGIDDILNSYQDEEVEESQEFQDYLKSDAGQKVIADTEKQMKKEKRQAFFSGLASTVGSVVSTVVEAISVSKQQKTAEETQKELEKTQSELNARLSGYEDTSDNTNTILIVVVGIVVVALLFMASKK